MKNAVSRILVSSFVISGSFAGSNIATAASDHQNLLETACRSSDPVLVIDSFPPAPDSPPTVGIREAIVDIDGDDAADLFHGELVEQLVQVSGHTTKRLNLSETSSLPDVYELLLPIVVAIERGEISYSRINLSQENPLPLASFKKDLFPDDPTFPEITATNIEEHSQRILEKIWTDRPDLMIQELHDLFARLEKAGVPVIVAAGNFGPNFVNMFSVLPGAITVGSLEVTGKKLFTSSDNAYVTEWKPGVVVPVAVQGGVDIDGDTKPEFLTDALTNGTAIVEKWVGQSLATSLSKVTSEFIDWATKAAAAGFVVPNAAVNIIDNGLYLTEDLVELPTVTNGTKNLFRSLGSYALKMSGSAPRYFFEVSADGVLRYDPKRDGTLNQRTRIGGTSFAAPRICGRS